MSILVAIESPFAGNVQRNIAYAKRCVHDCLSRGESPYASHLFFTQDGILDDTKPEQRTLGIESGLAWAAKALLVAVYVDHGISDGMRAGIYRAISNRQDIVFRALDRDVSHDRETHADLLRECGAASRTPHFVHTLKCWPEYFDAIRSGSKTFEIRVNDRGFRVADVLVLREWTPTTQEYSGRQLRVRVTCMVQGPPFLPGKTCVMGIERTYEP
jgi:hypothetical protein